MSDQPNQPNSKDLLPSDFPEVMEIEATYSNWFLCTGGGDGVRITFGECFDKGDDWVTGHQAVFMSLQTSIKLYNMLGSVIQALLDAKQKELKAGIAKLVQEQTTGPIPENKKN